METLFIVKIGGNVIDNPVALKKFLDDFATIKERKILIHGGGKLTTELADKLGIVQQMVEGRRITDSETLKIATMVYAGLLNKQVVALLQANGVNSLGLSGADLNSIKTSKRKHAEIDFGFVGDIEDGSINTTAIKSLIEGNITPVFCAITHDGKGQLLNTNADTIASALAVALSKDYEVQLNYCFEKKGVLKNKEDESSVIKQITKVEYGELIRAGIISQGMIPKMDNSFDAISKGVKTVIIGHSNDLLKMIDKYNNAGTKLVA